MTEECVCKTLDSGIRCALRNQIGVEMRGVLDKDELALSARLVGEPAKDAECVKREVDASIGKIASQFKTETRGRNGSLEISVAIPRESLDVSTGLEGGELFYALDHFGEGLWDASDYCVH